MDFYVLVVIGYWHDAMEACQEFYRWNPGLPRGTLKLIHINEESVMPCARDESGEGEEFCVDVAGDEPNPDLETYIRRQLPLTREIFYSLRGEPGWSWHAEIGEYLASLGWANLDALRTVV